ncbi:hypothetical protein AMS68_005652 [Peltaster fructicola]|uniref:RecQ-like DNA helicase BLM n=1 Tax=Peltaster fructicola TaxID=286661 RepID=A0A6H0XZP2_9PEZI|nr:hypothetical protein AMS68_005652 [Peltaster fructicola]
MTRNNLAEHLRWLLQTRPSEAIPTLEFTHENNSLQSRSTNETILTNLGVEEELFGDGIDDHDLLDDQYAPTAPPDMQRRRDIVQIHATSPNVTGRSTERQRATMKNSRAMTPSSMTVPQTSDLGDDIEILDMTEGLHCMLSPDKLDSKLPKQTVPRKRKSDDFDITDHSIRTCADQGSKARRSKTPATDKVNVTTEHDIPDVPPPPYSTVPPKQMVTRDDAHRDPVATNNRLDRFQDDELFDFSNKRLHERKTTTTKPLTTSSKDCVDVSHNLSQKKSLPSSSIKTTISEDVKLLRQFSDLPQASIQQISDGLAVRLDAMIDEIAHLHDEGDEEDQVNLRESELRDLTHLQDAITALQKSGTKMKWLITKRDEQFANLRAAIRQLDTGATEQAKAANQAAKAELESFEKECLKHIEVARDEIERAVEQAQLGPLASKHVAIEASQVPQRHITHVAFEEGSSARIAQTQAVTRPVSSTPTGFAHPSVSRSDVALHFDIQSASTRQDQAGARASTTMPTPNTSFHGFDVDDDFPMDDDDFCELDADVAEVDKFNKPAAPQRSALRETSINVIAGSSSKGKSAKGDDSQVASLFNHPWSGDVKRTLKEQFKLQGFRQGQLEAINATLSGHDAFVLMPTGGGKSLCYQLPSQIKSGKTQGITIIISPLLSLMEDQVQHLRKLRIQAFLLNGDTSQSERRHIFDTLARPDAATFIHILYITPEMLSKSQAMINSMDRLYSNKRFARLVIDEAHCVSQWGHDFRPDYKLIGEVRRKYPSVPVMALTATATENVKVDTIHNLGMDGCKIFTRSFNRPNLYYEVRKKGKSKDVLADIATLIKEKHNKQTGIVYCLSRRNCEETAEALRKTHKIMATHYHAGMKPAEKSEVQQGWQAGRWHVIVATIAFGMGIDKSNVRYVIHHSLPKSLEGYYQETGRAGRDGGQSSCYLYFSFSDVSKLRRMIIDNEDGSREQKDRQLAMLSQMVQYCDNKADCRRVQVLRYFSEAFQKHECKHGCDVCCSDASFTMQDVTKLARQACDIVKSFDGEQVTLLKCVDVFRGTNKKNTWSDSEAAGAGKDLDRGEAERLFYALIADGALMEYQFMNKAKFPVQYIKSAPGARQVSRLELAMRSSPDGKSKNAVKPRRAARDARELPLSTNVSSPIQAVSSRRKKPVPLRSDCNLDRYKFDDFMIPDDEDDEDYEDDSDAFESVATHIKPPRVGPITTDGVLDDLDPLHQALVEDFVGRAGQKVREIMSRDRLRGALFPDSILRQMAMRFSETLPEMKKIPGIVPEQVDHYGPQFCKLIKQCRQSFEEMRGEIRADAGTASNPNGNVIDLCTDDEDNLDDDDEDEEDEYGDFDGLDVDEEELFSGTARPISAEVAAFNDRFAESQSAANRIKPATESKGKSGWKTKRREYRAVSGGSKGEGSYRGRGGRASGGRPGGVSKKSTSRRPKDGAGRAKTSFKSSFISAMPT